MKDASFAMKPKLGSKKYNEFSKPPLEEAKTQLYSKQRTVICSPVLESKSYMSTLYLVNWHRKLRRRVYK